MMKKIRFSTGWVATAIAAATGAAHAQSNVTVYGRLDVAARWTSNVNSSGDSLKELTNGSMSGSRLGFRGTEDLGGGLKASFVLEQGIKPDTGTLGQGGRAFGRQAWLALETPYATISAGRQYSPLDLMLAENEAFGYYFLSNPGYIYENNIGPDIRWDNSVKASGKFGPVEGSVMVAAGEGRAGNLYDPVGRKMGATLSWGSGPFAINAGVEQGENSAGQKSHKAWTLGGNYAIGPAKLYASYLDHRSDAAVTLQANRVWALGASYAVTPSVDLTASYQRDTLRNINVGSKSSVIAMASYKLSKRTNVYVQADRTKLSGNYAANVFDQYPLPAGITSSNSATAGIRHQF